MCMNDSMKLWYAMSKKGQGRVFTSLPVRSEPFGCWVGDSVGAVSTVFMLMEAEGMAVPDLKWKDEPVEMTLTIKIGE